MNGLELEYKNILGETLRKLLKNIKLSDYDLVFNDVDIIDYNNSVPIPAKINEELFEKDILNSDCLILFINIQAYPKGTPRAEIVTHDDFSNSDCALILLVVDGIYLEIYCKNEELINQIGRNARDTGCTNIKRKTNENDDRTRMQL